MKKEAIFFFIFLVVCNLIHSQNMGAYLIPRQIYIGDPAALIMPLPGSSRDSDDIILTSDFPSHPNIDFHRITLQQRTAGSRLTIEFAAFVTGSLELPAIEIGEYRFTGLTVTVNSLVEKHSSIVMSGPASSLAMPGTALMIYGALAVLIILILLSIWFIFNGRFFWGTWNEKWKFRKLFISMKFTEKRLRRSILKGGDKRIILDKLSDKFRIFLSFLTDSNCRAMTALEFEKLPLELLKQPDFNPLFLHDFFRKCDELRFSGAEVSSQDILQLLTSLRFFLAALVKSRIAA